MTRWRAPLVAVGLLCALMGMLWIGQGLGYIHWPSASPMLDQRQWSDRGAALAVFGLVLILVGRRICR